MSTASQDRMRPIAAAADRSQRRPRADAQAVEAERDTLVGSRSLYNALISSRGWSCVSRSERASLWFREELAEHLDKLKPRRPWRHRLLAVAIEVHLPGASSVRRWRRKRCGDARKARMRRVH